VLPCVKREFTLKNIKKMEKITLSWGVGGGVVFQMGGLYPPLGGCKIITALNYHLSTH